jgi:hypothetical protein
MVHFLYFFCKKDIVKESAARFLRVTKVSNLYIEMGDICDKQIRRVFDVLFTMAEDDRRWPKMAENGRK